MRLSETKNNNGPEELKMIFIPWEDTIEAAVYDVAV
jgi:hypothetical protein